MQRSLSLLSNPTKALSCYTKLRRRDSEGLVTVELIEVILRETRFVCGMKAQQFLVAIATTGLSKAAFISVTSSSHCFKCPRCRLDCQEAEIHEMKKSIQFLVKEIEGIKLELASKNNSHDEARNAKPKPSGLVSNSAEKPSQHTKHEQRGTPTGNQHRETDRKFNIVVVGVEESNGATTRSERQTQDMDYSRKTRKSIGVRSSLLKRRIVGFLP